MAKLGTTVVKDRTRELMRDVEALVRRDVLVGIPDDDGAGEVGAQSGGNARTGSGEPNNAQLGYIHEHGAPEANIPERPFLVPGVRAAQPQVEHRLKAAAKAALDGNTGKMNRNLHAAGMEAQISVQRKLQSGPFAPLAPATIAARRRRSAGSSYRRKATTPEEVKPLIDTAQMLRAVTYVVRDKG